MSELAVGEYAGTINATRVVKDSEERHTAEFLIDVDGHDDVVTAPFRLYGKAEDISVAAISRLGYRGTLQQIADNDSSLTGMRVTLVVKQGSPRTNGGFFVNYNVLPLRKIAATKVRDLKFGEPPAGGGSW